MTTTMLLLLLSTAAPWSSQAYTIMSVRTPSLRMQNNHFATRRFLSSANNNNNNDNNDDDNSNINPYADPNYPDLEFVDYSDPEYSADNGSHDEFYDSDDSTEAQIEAMREERRRKNDEFQFNTYFSKTYLDGATFAGEWTVYKVNWPEAADDDDDDDTPAVPTLSQFKQTLPVTTRLQANEQGRWIHVEEHHTNATSATTTSSTTTTTTTTFDWDAYYKPYWPHAMEPFDFRGQQGNMVCGDAWTVCQAVNAAHEPVIEGPFKEYRAEVGLSYGSLMRYRLKLDYAAAKPDCLQLQYLTVCREVVVERELRWPRDHPNYEIREALFGEPGAEGGLYDPPPIADGTEHNYILLDLPGHATTLIPATLDPSLSTVNWVTSLDWTPGQMRYQVDRKVGSGNELLGLRSLELSEVQAADADEYRPRDGGQDMRQ